MQCYLFLSWGCQVSLTASSIPNRLGVTTLPQTQIPLIFNQEALRASARSLHALHIYHRHSLHTVPSLPYCLVIFPLANTKRRHFFSSPRASTPFPPSLVPPHGGARILHLVSLVATRKEDICARSERRYVGNQKALRHSGDGLSMGRKLLSL